MDSMRMIPVEPMHKGSAVDFVINQIKDLLMRNIIKPGDRLPSETEMCERLGVSRGSLRSAMKVFEALGVVDIRVGDGTYVCSTLSAENLNPLIFSLLIVRPGFDDFVKFREKIELDILDLIMKDPELIKAILPKLEKNLEELHRMREDEATSTNAFWENEKEFHMILADGCNNIIFKTVYSFTFDFFSCYIEASHKRQEYCNIVCRDHQRIYKAILDRNFSASKTAIIESMESWVNLLR